MTTRPTRAATNSQATTRARSSPSPIPSKPRTRIGPVDKSPNFWKNMQDNCAASGGAGGPGTNAQPTDTPSTTPDETKPDPNAGDSGASQGAPAPKQAGTEGEEAPDTPADALPRPATSRRAHWQENPKSRSPRKSPRSRLTPAIRSISSTVHSSSTRPTSKFPTRSCRSQ